MMLLQHQRAMSNRGGRREGAGGKPSWRHGKTKPVRVPVALADKILEIARILDQGDLEGSSGDVEVIDLTRVPISYSRLGPVVRLSDLIDAGYRLKPDRLMNLAPFKPSRSQLELEDLLLLAEERLNE